MAATRRKRIVNVVVSGLLFATLGFFLGALGMGVPSPVLEIPAPHTIALMPYGTSLRFAMVNDVIHQRFAKHGQTYYQERNRRARAAIEAASERPVTYERLELMDDLGAGLDHLGNSEAAVQILREKLALLEELAPGGPERIEQPIPPHPQNAEEYQLLLSGGLSAAQLAYYRTYANLGTFLIHSGFKRVFAGDSEGRAQIEEGLGFIRQAIQVNPGAHFGRESWQVVAVEHFLAAMEDPQLLLRYDLIGNDLSAEPEEPRKPHLGLTQYRAQAYGARDTVQPGEVEESQRLDMRLNYIRRVGAAPEWVQRVGGSLQQPVPFDAPALGITGMWLLGGGANPHFALALGEIMERVGQRYLAWAAYARATELSERFWPDPKLQAGLVAHCLARQGEILRSMREPQEELQTDFEVELAYGQAYQEAYAAYEAEQIAAGADIAAPDFYDSFHAAHGDIASPVGKADLVAVQRDVMRRGDATLEWRLMLVLLGLGLGGLIGLALRSGRA